MLLDNYKTSQNKEIARFEKIATTTVRVLNSTA